MAIAQIEARRKLWQDRINAFNIDTKQFDIIVKSSNGVLKALSAMTKACARNLPVVAHKYAQGLINGNHYNVTINRLAKAIIRECPRPQVISIALPLLDMLQHPHEWIEVPVHKCIHWAVQESCSAPRHFLHDLIYHGMNRDSALTSDMNVYTQYTSHHAWGRRYRELAIDHSLDATTTYCEAVSYALLLRNLLGYKQVNPVEVPPLLAENIALIKAYAPNTTFNEDLMLSHAPYTNYMTAAVMAAGYITLPGLQPTTPKEFSVIDSDSIKHISERYRLINGLPDFAITVSTTEGKQMIRAMCKDQNHPLHDTSMMPTHRHAITAYCLKLFVRDAAYQLDCPRLSALKQVQSHRMLRQWGMGEHPNHEQSQSMTGKLMFNMSTFFYYNLFDYRCKAMNDTLKLHAD
jgi:hypothetical protein